MTITSANKTNQSLSDEKVKELAIQNHKKEEVKTYKFPTEQIDLPSKGLVYSKDNPLSSGKIEMKYMTAKEEDILTTQSYIKQGIVLDKLFQSLIISDVNYNDIIAGDRSAIMVAARVLGYGKDYGVNVTCPKCNVKNVVSVDLTKLPEKKLDTTTMVDINKFAFELPTSKRKITFKILTNSDEQLIVDELAKQTFKDVVDRELSTRLKHIITSVDGNDSQDFINHFVDNEFFAQDSRALRAEVRRVSPEVDLEFSYTCPEKDCKHVTDKVSFTPGLDFFWPGA